MHMKTLDKKVTLQNGIEMPLIGYGTWQITDGKDAVATFKEAIRKGYRHIDTAALYANERSVGEAVGESGIPRSEFFITSKLQSTVKSYDGAIEAFEVTLEKLKMDYLDLYLIHAPTPWADKEGNYDKENVDVWKAFEKLYKEGKIKAIGVSNFTPRDLVNIIEHTDIVPHVNQIEFYVGLDQTETLDYCKKKGITVQAYSPLGRGKALVHKEVNDLADKYQVTPAQICLRYCIEKGTVPLPKAADDKHMDENAKLDFELRKEDVELLDSIKE